MGRSGIESPSACGRGLLAVVGGRGSLIGLHDRRPIIVTVMRVYIRRLFRLDRRRDRTERMIGQFTTDHLSLPRKSR
jgi:hypothetical protein